MIVDIVSMIIVVYIIVFGYIAIIKNQICCNNPIDYKNLANYTNYIIQKIPIEAIIIFMIREVALWNEGFGFVVPLVDWKM